jgi:hypothetical protein
MCAPILVCRSRQVNDPKKCGYAKPGHAKPGIRRLRTPQFCGAPEAAQGKFVTFGVTRGCIAVASPVSSITWLMLP